MMEVGKLWELLTTQIPRRPVQTIALADARRHVLAEDTPAAWDLPRFDNSAMDGFAVRSQDVARSTGQSPALLNLVGSAYAGEVPDQPISAGQCAPIGTGGMIPDGADTVVPVELTTIVNGQIAINKPLEAGKHIRRQGEECRQGDLVLNAGTTLQPRAIAALQAAGIHQVSVFKPPSITILTSGDELVPPGTSPGRGQIVETNGQLLARQLPEMVACQISRSVHAGDQSDALVKKLSEALERDDIVITTGGVSVGDKDLIKQTALALGMTQLVWKVAQKPGKPVFIATRENRVLLGLPGNPAAVAVGISVIVAPLIRAAMGQDPAPTMYPVTLSEPVAVSADRLQWCWATLKAGSGNELLACPLKRRGSHMLSDLACADILLRIPAGQSSLAAGSIVFGIPLP